MSDLHEVKTGEDVITPQAQAALKDGLMRGNATASASSMSVSDLARVLDYTPWTRQVLQRFCLFAPAAVVAFAITAMVAPLTPVPASKISIKFDPQIESHYYIDRTLHAYPLIGKPEMSGTFPSAGSTGTTYATESEMLRQIGKTSRISDPLNLVHVAPDTGAKQPPARGGSN